jgi:hypothetical protein
MCTGLKKGLPYVCMGGSERGSEMSVVAGVGKATGAEVLRGARPAKGRAFPTTKRALVVVALLALLAALISASEAPNAEHYYSAGSTHDQSGALVSQPAAAPQMSERERP